MVAVFSVDYYCVAGLNWSGDDGVAYTVRDIEMFEYKW